VLVEALRQFKRTYDEPRLVERPGFGMPNRARLDLAAPSRRLDDGPGLCRVG